MSTLGERIKQLRVQFAWTQEELALKIDARKQVISNWERNVAKPELKHLIKLADVFRVSTDYLLGVEGNLPSTHPQDGIEDIYDKQENWKFQESFDLIEAINSGYQFKMYNEILTSDEKEIISKSIAHLMRNVIWPLKEKNINNIGTKGSM
ncbi:hypothetical protein GCM10008018_45320 [Paenibacillus marchantiophytorum]|uniref:HTH cro/C1-type domain-containing protein n=1 Tax=Paenibacillus marchantiophytorum TaxID=1619310 RepID=A0ABQ1EYW9_9BACL|nr:helix-turn-helix domain-containing protein [Paenibacillus marchantiophytorum]GFZ93819.1 hypothetical protein GCM10008018_45320 [Paenibacillus marchantiophytorum]